MIFPRNNYLFQELISLNGHIFANRTGRVGERFTSKNYNSYFSFINKLELLDRLTKNCEQNSFAEGKSASFSFIWRFRQTNRNSKGSETKVENSGGEVGLAILEFRGQRGVKILMPPVVGYGYFLESPISTSPKTLFD